MDDIQSSPQQSPANLDITSSNVTKSTKNKWLFILCVLFCTCIVIGTLLLLVSRRDKAVETRSYSSRKKSAEPVINKLTPNKSLPVSTSVRSLKTFMASGRKYQFDYPADWNSSVATNESGNAITVYCYEQCSAKDTVINFVVANSSYNSVQEFKSKSDGIVDFSSTYIDGVPAVVALRKTCSACTATEVTYFLSKEGQGYIIAVSYKDKEIPSLADLPASYPDILSTFKFLQ